MTYQIQTSFAENFKITTDINIAKQALTTSYTTATGSEISYKPAPSSSFVVYHYSVLVAANTDSGSERNAKFKLQYSDNSGSSWSDWGDNTEVYVHSAGSYMKMKSIVDVKLCLNTSGWSNNKLLRLVVLQDTGSDTALHQMTQVFADETVNTYSNQRYFPSVSCYSVD